MSAVKFYYRIGVVTNSQKESIKGGSLGATWTEYKGVKSLALSGGHVGVLTTDGRALVKEGDLGFTWVDEYKGLTALALSGNRIGVLTTDGQVGSRCRQSAASGSDTGARRPELARQEYQLIRGVHLRMDQLQRVGVVLPRTRARRHPGAGHCAFAQRHI